MPSAEVTSSDHCYVVTVRFPEEADASRLTMTRERGLVRLEIPRGDAAGDNPAPNFEGAKEAAATRRDGDVQREDVVGEASDMSFPASDPPSWSPGRTGGAS